MDVIQTEQCVKVKIFYNRLDCPYRRCCPEREKREETLMMGRCSFNPSIFECEAYLKFNPQAGMEKIIDLRCL